MAQVLSKFNMQRGASAKNTVLGLIPRFDTDRKGIRGYILNMSNKAFGHIRCTFFAKRVESVHVEMTNTCHMGHAHCLNPTIFAS